MTHVEVEECLRNMVFLVDNREQPTARLRERLKWLEPYERTTILVGDYTAKTLLPDGTWFFCPVNIERKMNFSELVGCFCQERKRFVREFERAKEHGIKMILLVENATWEDAYLGNYRSKMTPQSFIASMLTWMARYDCQVLFCKHQTTGRLIHDILRYEMREALERMMN